VVEVVTGGRAEAVASRTVPSQKDVRKRRVTAEQATVAQERAATSRDRRKRWTVGLVGGGLAFMLVLSLAGGALVIFLGGDDDPPPLDTLLTEPAVIRPIPDGAALTGATPCPAIDGTQERTISFAEAPELCIDPALDYDVTLTTDVGEIVVRVDPGLDETGANLFVTMARYGLYDDMAFSSLVPEGLAVSGDPGEIDPGFTVDPTSADGGYQVGSVIMFADLPGTIASRFAFIATPRFASLLEEEPIHPMIGNVTVGQEVIDAIIAIGSSPDIAPLPTLDLRIQSAVVTEVG
jgi:cyclophilin family peptidyl-prolyl cis-trans isomerase